jgi:fibronectin-binding autotransporter adhesin
MHMGHWGIVVRDLRGLQRANSFSRWKSCALLLALAWCVCTNSLEANTFTVTSTDDTGAAGTLRWAIDQANGAGAGAHTISITLPPNATITLTGALPALNNAAGTIAIEGAGTDGLTIHGNNAHRAFFVLAGTVEISNVHITDTLAKGGNGGADPLAGGGGGLGAGGGIFVNAGANVTIQDVTFHNSAANGGTGGTLSGAGVGGGGGGGGLGGNGGDGAAQGGGGGGGVHSHGGNGGIFAGGGGGGVILNGSDGGVVVGGTGSIPGGNGGDMSANGADGATFGGAGGGGSGANGGTGGTFGGGGGAGQGGTGGTGGFGGGGGGASVNAAGTGGFGGGNGGSSDAGSGGSGYGGALFVRQGGTLTIRDSSTSNNSVAAGASGGGSAAAGSSGGQDLYLMTGVNAGFGGTTNTYTGSISGAGAITVQSTGTTTLSGTNNYTGGTTVTSGTLQGTTDSLQGDITNGANVTFSQAVSGAFAGAISGAGNVTKSGAGTVTFSGANTYDGGTTVSVGKLQGTSTSLQGAIVNDAQVEFNQNFDGSYAGAMSGTGSLTKSGTGNLKLVGVNPFSGQPNNNYSGGTTVSAGTLTGTSYSLQGAIDNDAIVVFDQDGFAGQFLGSISGTGSVTIEDGVVEFMQSNSYSGGTTITGAALVGDSTSIQGDILVNSGAAVDFFQFVDGTYAGDLTGSGTFYKLGTASLTLTGNNTFSGSTNLQEGRLVVNGVLNGEVSVSQGATLGGNATFGGNVIGGGTVAPGNSIGTLNIGGNYAVTTTEIEIAPDGNTPGVHNDLVVVGGTAYVDGCNVRVLAAPGAYTLNTTYTFLQAAGGIDGQFQSITDDLAMYNAVLVYDDPNAVSFRLGPMIANFASLGVTPNQIAVGNYLDENAPGATGDFEAFLFATSLGTTADIRSALNQLQGQIYATLPSANIQQTTQNLQMLRNQLAFADPCLNGDEEAGWIRGYGTGGTNIAGFNADGYRTGVGGTEIVYQQCVGDGSSVGAFGNIGWGQLGLDTLDEQATLDNYQFGASAKMQGEVGYLLGLSGFGFQNYDVTRNLDLVALQGQAESSVHAWQQFDYLEFGRRLNFVNFELRPFIAGQYIYLGQGGTRETGVDPVNLVVQDQSLNSFRTFVGAAVDVPMATMFGDMSAQVRTSWMHECADSVGTFRATFDGVGGTPFLIQGVEAGREFLNVGTGIRLAVTQRTSMFLAYDLQANNRQAFNTGSGGLEVAW